VFRWRYGRAAIASVLTVDDDSARAVRLGEAIRSRRLDRGLTLVQVAELTGLTHGFLSQVERGLSSSSLRSLFLIAEALGTTQQTLLAAATPDPGDGALRRDQGISVAGSRVLLSEHAGVSIVEFTRQAVPPADFFRHAASELVYVVDGSLLVETRAAPEQDVESAILDDGDSILIHGGVDHRHTAQGAACRYLLVSLPAEPSPVHGPDHATPPIPH